MSLPSQDPLAGTAGEYRRFARLEARGRSPAYEALAMAVAGDRLVLAFLASLPAGKRQPNLLFAAARYLLGEAADIGARRWGVVGPRDELAGVMRARRTQTNEPARCATLLPVLAQLPQPLALLEVGASAGLTLLVDRYSYDYGGHKIAGTDPAAPLLACQARGPLPIPDRVPSVAWRAGLDLNPLDVADPDDARWLECLLWPGEHGRAERLAAAIAAARRDPPPVHRGDLLTDLPALAGQAPPGVTLVIYHSAVLGYVAPPDRRRFAAAVGRLGAVWLSSEGPGVVPGVTLPDDARVVPGVTRPDDAEGSFVVVRDGTSALALADPHGAWLRWLAPAQGSG
jgi:hypothetical protein